MVWVQITTLLRLGDLVVILGQGTTWFGEITVDCWKETKRKHLSFDPDFLFELL